MSNPEPPDGTEECITIQPAGQNGGVGVVPKPYHVWVADGTIARQDYWRGNPAQLIGFVGEAGKPDVDFLFEDWLIEPKRAIGNYPVFADSTGNFSTALTPIESIHHTATLAAHSRRAQR
jgi:hypothetical protein